MIHQTSPIAVVVDKPAKQKRLAEGLGIRTIGDLLRHFPRRYEDLRQLTTVDDLHEDQLLMVVGEIIDTDAKQYRDRRTGHLAYRFEATLKTDGPSLHLSLFAKKKYMADHHEAQHRVGRRGIFTGKVKRFGHKWQLTNPLTEWLDETDEQGVDRPDFYAVYPLTDKISSAELQNAVAFALSAVEDFTETLPASVRSVRGYPEVATAYKWIHRPDELTQAHQARARFRFEEALVTQVVLARRRLALEAVDAVARTGGDLALSDAFDARLPFELTDAQVRVGEEIAEDLSRSRPMNRLLQGEVGSGKTLVALRAMLRVVDSGGQAALLAPTEVLAAQHHRSLVAMLGDLAEAGLLGGAEVSTRIELLTGSMTKTQRREPLLRLASGEAGIVVGTHALLEETVQFADLGLVVVDEQHRFGVEQRAKLTEKGRAAPHVLVMTATPIPRTVAMTVFGDLTVSTIAELPHGRAPIQTHVVDLGANPGWMARVWERVHEEVRAGRQVYLVCPRISENDESVSASSTADGEVSVPLAAAESTAQLLSAGVLSELRVGLLHGRLPADEKDATMQSFSRGDIDVLVATTVIEVGVDVPNATTMIVLNAERFGVSQLHQLRGRVGRGGHAGLCLLVSEAEADTPARERLDAVAATTDGFELSRIDLEQRREGDVLGRSQSGWRSSLVNLRVLRDEKTIQAARETAVELLAEDPELAAIPGLAQAVADLEESTRSDFLEKS